MFVSALGAIIGGEDNRLKLPRVKSAAVVLIDGLGLENLRTNLGYAATLRKAIGSKEPASIRVGFPATTAVSLASLGTGLRGGSHGIVGYQVADNEGHAVNMLNSWGGTVDPVEWQPHETVAERASNAGVSVYFVGPTAYEGSGFTNVFMRGATYVPENDVSMRVEKAQELLSNNETLVYLYFPELDQAAHRFGVDSTEWASWLERVDNALAPLLSTKAGVLVTADHGVIDVAAENHLYLDALPGFTDAVRLTLGDPRAAYLYGDEAAIDEVLAGYKNLGYLVSHDELVEKGWCAPFTGLAAIPERFFIAKGSVAIYDRRTAKSQSLKMVGQHGSLDDIEQRVPLLKLGGFA